MLKGIVANELIGGTFDRMVTYLEDGTLRIEETPELIDGQGWTPGQTVVLRNWEEIERLRDFLNSLQPVAQREVEQHERSIA